mmetsp:Transcript_7658/g.20936  ORF Transcript_7658/g.20936 Transcript_7658/m.20936 type:complete len:232 (-) Transcript_7658:1384-2079(-)
MRTSFALSSAMRRRRSPQCRWPSSRARCRSRERSSPSSATGSSRATFGPSTWASCASHRTSLPPSRPPCDAPRSLTCSTSAPWRGSGRSTSRRPYGTTAPSTPSGASRGTTSRTTSSSRWSSAGSIPPRTSSTSCGWSATRGPGGPQTACSASDVASGVACPQGCPGPASSSAATRRSGTRRPRARPTRTPTHAPRTAPRALATGSSSNSRRGSGRWRMRSEPPQPATGCT